IIVNLQPEILGSYLEWFEDLDTGEKPLLISVSEREFVMEDVKAMERLGFQVYSTPERAAQVISSMYHFAHREIIEGQEREFQVDRGKVRRIIDDCVSDGREAIGGAEAFEVLEAYGILVMGYSVASSPEEAAAAAQRFGGPVAMKIESGKVLHKSDLGGVELGVEDPVEAYTRIVDRVLSRREDLSREDIQGVCVQPMAAPGRETLIGASWEEGMGCHVIKFGYGGKYTELFQDVALRIAPLDDARARAMVDDTRLIGPLLRGIRGDEPSDVEAVIDTLLRLSQLITDFPEIEQVEANPFTVGGEGAAVLDARFALGEVQSDGSKSPGSKVKDPAVDASP
ncbi:MAG: acetate--CoA ligase family protein, partial [Methanomassiliicoccales archaeon]